MLQTTGRVVGQSGSTNKQNTETPQRASAGLWRFIFIMKDKSWSK